ncbi:reverse transcriptase domain-containing protein [Tanacetum coccineum]
MLRVFPITLKRCALGWKKRLPAVMINTWDLLEKEFIWQYCTPFKTAKKLEENHNFKQEIDETLYHAWERYSDLLYRCSQHDLNCQQKVHIFYTGLDISSRRMLDSRRFIPLMTPTQALKSIQVMADHSHNWAHLTKECPLEKEDKAVEQSEKVKARTIMGKESVKELVPRNLPPMSFLGHLKAHIGSPNRTCKTVCMIENPGEVHKLKAREDKGDRDVMQSDMLLGPIHDKEEIIREQDYDIPLQDGMMQPLTPQTVHIKPPNDDYVAPATSPTLDKQLNEFGI